MRDAMTWMRDAMTPDRARDVLIGMQGEAMAFAASELPRSAQRQKDAAQDAIAALALALAALDRAAAAEATVRELRELCEEAACAVHASNPMRPDLYARLRAAAAAHPASEGVAK